MGRVAEKNRIADVICQHKTDGTIIPIKIRLQDDDGQYQEYRIKAYKDLTHYGNRLIPNRSDAMNHKWEFECKIIVFGIERRIRLFYNSYDNKWQVM